jgi:LysM repeat protein
MPSVFWRALMPLCGCLWLCGCFPPADGASEEERNPLLSEARAKKAAYNYEGAVATLDKALEANPRLAPAHWELGLLYYENLNDYAAAIYHFEKLLKLRPQWRHARTARQFIDICKIELAKSAPPIPQTPQIQRLIDNLTAKQVELTRENTQLKERVQALQVLAQQLAAQNAQLKQEAAKLASPPAPAPAPGPGPRSAAPLPQRAGAPLPPSNVPARASPATPPRASPALSAPGLPVRTNLVAAASQTPTAPSASQLTQAAAAQAVAAKAPALNASAKPKTLTVKPGETVFGIARRYGIKQSDLLAANPGLEPGKLKAGQILCLPAP